MKTALTCLCAAAVGALLLACAAPPHQAKPAAKAAPAAAALDPEARNRQATALAEAGDLTGAIALWRPLAERAHAPQAAYLLRNLGYAEYLHHDYQAALTTLGRACLLDPLSARGWRQLGAVFDKLGQGERARLMYRQASALEEHDLKADLAAAPTPSPAIATAAAAPPAAGDWPGTVTLDASSGMVALPAPAPVAADARVVLLEISNGNGVRGLAAATARALDDARVRVVRLTNQHRFDVRVTRLEYEPAQRGRAQQLAPLLGTPDLVEVPSCQAADMRLVLGKDRLSAQETARTRRAARQRAG